jgi:hypothetical protein
LGKTVKGIKHKLDTDGYTACGIDLDHTSSTVKTNKTWKGVTCKRCLVVKAKSDMVKATKKTAKVTSCVGGFQ